MIGPVCCIDRLNSRGELFTLDGKRKYLTAEEQGRFIAAAKAHERAGVRTFCLMLAHTGCRISEALQLTPERIDLSDKSITFRTLKQHDKVKCRSAPYPDTLLDAIELVHSVRNARRSTKLKTVVLWSWGRTQATKHIQAVMEKADISGDHATPKGLRHGFGVRMTMQTRNPRLVQSYRGIPILKRRLSIWILLVKKPTPK